MEQLKLDEMVPYMSIDKISKKYPKIPKKLIKEYILSTKVGNITSIPTKPRLYNTIKANDVGDCMQMDLMDVSNYKTNNNKVAFLLTAIDIYSRYAFAYPLTSKYATNVLKGIKEIFLIISPKNLTVDSGTEFTNKEITRYLKNKNITLYIEPKNKPNKNAVIERFHRTFRNIMTRHMVQFGTRYIDKLDFLLEVYNNSYHRTIKATPNDIFNGKTENKQEYNTILQKFRIGDKVRLLKRKDTFEKGVGKFSKEIYEIKDVNQNSYNINKANEARQFMPYELRLANEEEVVNDKPLIQMEKLKQANKVKRKIAREGLDTNLKSKITVAKRNTRSNKKSNIPKFLQ